jgi:hypothetical protein
MTKIDSPTLTSMRPQIIEALKELSDRLGVDFRLGRGSYSPSGITGSLVLELAARDVEGGKSGAQQAFEMRAPSYGLTAADFEREFSHGGRRFKLVGINPKSPVNCLSIADVRTGTGYKLDLDSYKAAILYEEVIAKRKKAA